MKTQNTWGRRAAAVAVALMMTAALCVAAGCSKADKPLEEGVPQWASEPALREWTAQAIDEFNEGDYAAIAEALVDGTMTAEQLEEDSAPEQEKLGAFEALGDVEYYNGESLGRPYVCAVQEATYENGAAQFRISFFEDGKLAAFYFLPNEGETQDAAGGKDGGEGETAGQGADTGADEAAGQSADGGGEA